MSESKAKKTTKKSKRALTIKQLVWNSRVLAEKNGFWEQGYGDAELATKLALIHSEVSEALEELRSPSDDSTYARFKVRYRDEASTKPEGFIVELADAVIRIADLAGALGLDLEDAIVTKHAYNKTRPYKHGKEF